MKFLSWLFFCLSPFALFCTENGGGLILCPAFIILGVIFKHGGNNIEGNAVVEIEPQKFWEYHYKDRMRITFAQKQSINDGLMALKDKEARSWATTICGYHNAWVPPEEKQEQIARSNGVVTEKMVKESAMQKDRIQIGKYFLMNELKLKYDNVKTWRIQNEIKNDMSKIKIAHNNGVNDWYVKREYGMTVGEMWKTLSLAEKQQVEKWVKKYEEKLIQAVKEYESHNEYMIRSVKMDF